MGQAEATLETVEKVEAISFISARPGRQPIRNLEAFMAALPDVELEEADAFEKAIAENRAQRRASAENTEC